jgi:hypothetical protein
VQLLHGQEKVLLESHESIISNVPLTVTSQQLKVMFKLFAKKKKPDDVGEKELPPDSGNSTLSLE